MQKLLLCLFMILTLTLSGCSNNQSADNDIQNNEVETVESETTTKENKTVEEESTEKESNNSTSSKTTTKENNNTTEEDTASQENKNTTTNKKSTTTKENSKTVESKETTKKETSTKKIETSSDTKETTNTDSKTKTDTTDKTEVTEEKVEEKKYVTLTISCSNILKHDNCLETNYSVPSNGKILSKKMEISDGDSVLKILKNSGVRVDVSGGYVKGIDNLYEFDCGDESGWTYSVNGVKPNVGASQYKVKENDQIQWSYVVKRNEW